MAIAKRKLLADGSRQLTVTVTNEESLLQVSNTGFYRLGSQLDMVVPAQAIIDFTRVYWCPIEQKWVDA
jgi:hypothetical protein